MNNSSILPIHNRLKVCFSHGEGMYLYDQDNKKYLDFGAGIACNIEEKFTNLIFENGAIDIADFFIRENDKLMVDKAAKLDFGSMRIRDKIKELVKIRLQLNSNHKAAVKKLISFYSNPKRISYALKNCYKTADLIWYEIGDNSTDFNFYSKRIILSKIYIRTLHYFVNDDSKDNHKAFDFLDKQIEKVMKFSAFKFKVKNCFEKVQDVSGKLSTVSPKELVKKIPFIRLLK